METIYTPLRGNTNDTIGRPKKTCLGIILDSNTVITRQSIFQGTGLTHALYQGSLYCQHTNNYENTCRDQSLYALLAELC